MGILGSLLPLSRLCELACYRCLAEGGSSLEGPSKDAPVFGLHLKFSFATLATFLIPESLQISCATLINFDPYKSSPGWTIWSSTKPAGVIPYGSPAILTRIMLVKLRLWQRVQFQTDCVFKCCSVTVHLCAYAGDVSFCRN